MIFIWTKNYHKYFKYGITTWTWVPKKKSGRPKASQEPRRPDYKILQYDLEGVKIQATHIKEKTDNAFDLNEENLSEDREMFEVIILDGRSIYNSNTIEDLISNIALEIEIEEKIAFPIRKYKFAAQY